jgi:hypothetical protein
MALWCLFVLWAAGARPAAGEACDFGALDACPLGGNRSAAFPAEGAVDVSFRLSAAGGPMRLYLLSAAAFAGYAETGAAVPLADTCDPAGFTSCAGSVGVTVAGGPLYAVLEAVGADVRASGSVAVSARAAGLSRPAVAAVIVITVAAAAAIAGGAWFVRKKRLTAELP